MLFSRVAAARVGLLATSLLSAPSSSSRHPRAAMAASDPPPPRPAGTADYTTVDYLVVGAGASGMAFIDSLLLHTRAPARPSVLLLDRRAAPGGHWNDAYPFVTLHQSARNYGVESVRLEDGIAHPEQLATKGEVLAYYQRVLDGWRSRGHRVRFIGGASYDFEARTYALYDDRFYL